MVAGRNHRTAVRAGKRTKIRAFLSNAQARPGYVYGYSNFIVTR